jgi:hypothetical protein
MGMCTLQKLFPLFFGDNISTKAFVKCIQETSHHPLSKWVKNNNGFDVLFHWLLGFDFLDYIFNQFFSCMNISLLMNMGTYLYKLLNFIWCNVNGIKPILKPISTSKFWGSIKNWRFCKYKILSSNLD